MVDRGVGQRRATECPVCGAPPISNWTCVVCTSIINIRRELLRNLQQWRSLYEALEVPDVLVAADGREYALWDVQRFYESRSILPLRMRQSIQYCLFENMKERDAAVRMGIGASNPVSEYATIGLTTLVSREYRSLQPALGGSHEPAA